MKSTPRNLAADVFLVRRALRGDRTAVHELVTRLMPVVRAKARAALRKAGRHTLDLQLADDISQEIWLQLVRDGGRRLESYDPDRGVSLESFIAVLAEREAVSLWRRHVAQKRGGHLVAVELGDDVAAATTPSPEAQVLCDQLATLLHAHLENELSERGRLVWRHTFTDGHDPKETARILGVELQVVYNWQHKIRNLARSFLASESASS